MTKQQSDEIDRYQEIGKHLGRALIKAFDQVGYKRLACSCKAQKGQYTFSSFFGFDVATNSGALSIDIYVSSMEVLWSDQGEYERGIKFNDISTLSVEVEGNKISIVSPQCRIELL